MVTAFARALTVKSHQRAIARQTEFIEGYIEISGGIFAGKGNHGANVSNT
jgi:hypothetical protein